MIVGHIGGGSAASYEIQKSLRFRASASAYLSRTPGATSDRTKWTWSGWTKIGNLAADNYLFAAAIDANNRTGLIWSNGNLVFFSIMGGVIRFNKISAALYRDFSAHYHVMCAFDSTNGTTEDRARLYVNGVRVTSFSTNTFVDHTNHAVNDSAALHTHFRRPESASNYNDGYLSEVNFIDGQALTPSSFGEFSAETGAWIPKKYTGTYGTNGFYLPFNDGSNLTNLTADRSGNGNNWTANNISLTSGVTYDWMGDTPTNNFAVLNPLNRQSGSSAAVLTDGNLKITVPSGVNATPGAFAISTGTFLMASGKWYFEATGIQVSGAAGGMYAGVTNQLAYNFNGTNYYHGSFTSQFKGQASASDGVMIAYDADNGLVWVGKNGTWDAGNPSTGTGGTSFAGPCIPFVEGYNDTANRVDAVANFGQRPFAYTPPAGFKALCTKNLPTPSILNPKKHFDVRTFTTNDSVNAITGLSFQPDFVWTKRRDQAYNHDLYDSVRGTNRRLQSNNTNAENTDPDTLTAFNSNGFTLGTNDNANNSPSGGAAVGWAWKANGFAVTNNAGSIQSQVSANPQAGFSIVTYTGNGSTGSVGHGLGVAPKLVIHKSRGPTARNWLVNIGGVTGITGDYLYLNQTQLKQNSANVLASTASLLNLGNTPESNAAEGFVAYCFAEIPGYSKIGSYTGNGSADGPFVYCGFRPKFVMIKRTDASQNWPIVDTSRDTYNVANKRLFANLSYAEDTGIANYLDIVSNGFKCRDSNISYNANGGTYIFYAIAEQPFQFANAR